MTGADEEGGSPDWHDPSAYARLRNLDRAGLMWEWLRRDRSYIAWYARASRATGGDPLQWGLHFRRDTGSQRAMCPDHLVGGA